MGRKHQAKSSFKRRKPFKEPRTTVLIVCEGAKTEPLYFEALTKKWRSSSVRVNVIGGECGSAPINIVDYAVAKLLSSDITWCVFDVDQHTTLDAALDKAKANNIEVAVSNPCFEYWYILHYKKTGKAFQNNKEVRRELKGHYPGYKKNDNKIVLEIFPRTKSAIKHAKEILKEKGWEEKENLKDCNPSTHIYRLVERLREISDIS